MSERIAATAAWWDACHDREAALARRAWPQAEPTWGVFGIPERQARVLPDAADLEGKDVVELGCGTGYISAWLVRRGARPVGVDPSPSQLGIVQAMQQQHDLRFPIVRAAGEHVPLKDSSFDFAISEYGAAIWADPYYWIPEAARLLRPGGELIFLGNSALLMLCAPDEDGVAATDRLLRPQHGMHRFDWPDDPAIEFHLSHGDMIKLLRANDFEIVDLIELYASPDATTTYEFVTADWASRWPVEEVWRARRLPPRSPARPE